MAKCFSDLSYKLTNNFSKDIKKNSEIYDSYGNKSNVQLIMYYGFSIKDNKHSKLNFMHA